MIELISLTLALSFQAPQQEPPVSAQPPLRIPIHTQPDDPVGKRYGIWAAGPDYKVSFDDGFAFHPYIPDAEITRAWRWRTTSVRAGAEELLSGKPVIWHDDWRAEYRTANVTERYDVRTDGVEQSFVIHAKPRSEGAIVVRGVLDTPFEAEITGPRVGALEFAWDGSTVLRYGVARVFDAQGHEANIATAFDGKAIELQVDADFVARASFPLTIDPLTSTYGGRPFATQIIDTTVACSTAANTTRVAIGSVIRFSATDLDIWLYVVGDDPGSASFPIFTDITTSWSSTELDLAQIEGASKWALAFQRDFSGGGNGIRVYVDALSSSVPNAGTLVFGSSGTKPRIGGSLASGVAALLVYGAANGTDLHQQILDAPTATLGSVVVHETGASRWSVSKLRSPTQSWCVATESTAGNLIRVRFVNSLGILSGATDVTASRNGVEPEVDGDGSRFLLAWRDTTSVGLGQHRLRVQRFDRVGGVVTFGSTRSVVTTSLFSDIVNRGLAYDFLTQSHWAIVYEIRTPSTGGVSAHIARLGATGGVTESADLGAGPIVTNAEQPSVAMNGIPPIGTGEHEAFAVVCKADVGPSADNVVYRRLDYPADAGVVFSGTSCSNVTLGDGHPPYAGSEFYRSNLLGIAPGTAAFFALGFAPVDTPLDSIGMPGCRLLVDILATFPAVADGSGTASVIISLTDAPVFIGSLGAQWIWVDPAANSAGLRTSRRATIVVR